LHFSSIWTPTKYAIWTLISTVREDCMQEFWVFFFFLSSKAWILINGRDNNQNKALGETRMKIDLRSCRLWHSW
jgi:hypothetical protein